MACNCGKKKRTAPVLSSKAEAKTSPTTTTAPSKLKRDR